MSVGRTLRLVGAAMRTGASLEHDPYHLAPVDALHALGKVTDANGSQILHAKLGGEGIEHLPMMVLEIATVMFELHGWQVFDRRRFTRAQTMQLFAEQVVREFLGEPCPDCKGHGVKGQKLDDVRHLLGTCGHCHGRGFQLRKVLKSGLAATNLHGEPVTVRKICNPCAGKGLIEITEALKAGKLKACTTCEGTGIVRHSVRQRARALQYDPMHIYRVWNERFRAVLQELRRIERAALFECAVQLFDAE